MPKGRMSLPLAALVFGVVGSLVTSLASGALAQAEAGSSERPDPASWVICRPAEGHPAYRHAAEELARYIREVTGTTVPVRTDAERPAGKVRLVVGGPDVNQIARALAQDGRLSVPKDLGDGYVLKSVEDGADVTLVFAGLRGRGTLYGVYGYLRRHCDCGFFRDGDHIPRRTALPVRNIDVVERPVFPMREVFVFLFHYGPQAKYSSLWDFEQWKLWMDHAAKTGANSFGVYYFPGSFFAGDVFYKAFPECDPKLEKGQLIPPGERLALSRKVLAYLRLMDMDVIYGVSWGGLNGSFAAAFPERKFLPAGPGFHGQGVNLSVQDERFEETMGRFWTEVIRELGPADYYFIQYAHEQSSSDRYKAYDSAVRLFRKLDPDAKFIFWTWDLDWRPVIRDRDERLKEFLDHLPADAVIQDQYVSYPRGLSAKGTENPFGPRKWYHVNRFGEFHSGDRLGRGLGLRGHLILSETVRAQGKIPNGCIGCNVYNELDFGNFLGLQLARDCAWNPRRTADDFQAGRWLERYALERFGADSAPNMLASITASFEADVRGNLQIDLRPNVRDGKLIYDKVQPDLEKLKADLAAKTKTYEAVETAVRIALREKERQKDNPLYVTYLYDLVTQSMMDTGYDRFNLAWAAATTDPKSEAAREYLRRADEYLRLLNDLMASQDRDKLIVTLDRLMSRGGVERGGSYQSGRTENHFSTMIGTWHYNVISYEKWAAQFQCPFRTALKLIEDARAQGRAPTREELNDAVKPTNNGEVKHWWIYFHAPSMRELGKHKPAKPTLGIIEEILDRGLLGAG